MAEARAEYGPFMKQLPNERWRAFVENLMVQGQRNATQAYRDAGFNGTDETARVGAHRMMKDERVLRAIHEEGQRRIKGAMLALAQDVHAEILANPQTEPAVRLKAAFGVYDRAGLHAAHEVTHTHEHISSDGDTLARIARLATTLGLDVTKLLGNRVKPQTTDAEYVDLSANDFNVASVDDLI